MYCLTCKSNTASKDVSYATTKNNRTMIKGVCTICGRIKSQFAKATTIPASGGDLVSGLSKIMDNFQLPFQKFPGEMHLFGHSFTGPGTKLQYRLNPDGTPKEFSQPVDRVDLAAYHHDLEYARHSDTANRNVADRAMVQELDSIENPTMRERIERAIVKPIINTKQKFGLGLKDRRTRNFHGEASILPKRQSGAIN